MTLTALPPFDFELLLPPVHEDAPTHAQRLSRKALDALREGRYQEALEAFDRAIQLRPDDPETHFNRGVSLWYLGRYQDVVKAFERTLELQPDFPEAHLGHGAALWRMDRYPEAMASYEHAYPLRRKAAEIGQTLYNFAALGSLLYGLSALKRRSLSDYEKATDAFIKWRARARRDKQTAAFTQAVKEFKEALPAEDKETFEEFMLGVRLMSIRDPFKGWDALAKLISKDWPEGLSAVDAIRQERD